MFLQVEVLEIEMEFSGASVHNFSCTQPAFAEEQSIAWENSKDILVEGFSIMVCVSGVCVVCESVWCVVCECVWCVNGQDTVMSVRGGMQMLLLLPRLLLLLLVVLLWCWHGKMSFCLP